MEIKSFTLFWLTGEYQIVKGTDISSAMNNAGIGNGALRALDFYASGECVKDYEWDNDSRNWNKISKP